MRQSHRGRRRREIQDADPAVQVERALDLRQIVRADERLLVDEQQRRRRRRPRRRSRPSAGTSRRRPRARATVDDVQHARNRERARARRTAPESTAALRADRTRGPGRRRECRSRRPTCRSRDRAATAPRRSGPPAAIQPPTGATAIARPRNACVYDVNALGQRIPEHDRERDRRQHETRPRRAGPRRATNTTDDDERRRRRPRARHIAARAAARASPSADCARRTRASTSRLKPIAALRAVTMQRDNPDERASSEAGTSRAASSAPTSANGSANTEWLNADEGRVGAEAGEHADSGQATRRTRRAGTPLTRYSSTSRHAGRQRPRPRARRACPARSCRSRRQTRAPRRPRASRSRAGVGRRDVGRDAAQLRQLVEQVQRRRRRQAVGADRDGHARTRRSATTRGGPAPTHTLLRGQVTSDRRPRRAAARGRRRSGARRGRRAVPGCR